MRDVVVIPAANRPEFLARTLRGLSHASHCPPVHIYCDDVGEKLTEELYFVVRNYYPTATIHYASGRPGVPSGCWNILRALKGGYDLGAERVFLIEEDVLVAPQFFIWHYMVNDFSHEQYLATCGRKDKRFYPLYGPLYTNPGSCLTRRLLAEVVPHTNDDYFRRLRGYLDEKFGKWDEMSELDDGLIRRVVRQMNGKCLFPETAKCAHQGFRMYNKLNIYMNEGPIEERIARLDQMIESIKPGDRYAGDFEALLGV